MIRIILPLCCALLALTACEDDPAPPEPMGTQEAEALKDAATMLDEQRLNKESPRKEGDQPTGEEG